jgi:hypothetical protein
MHVTAVVLACALLVGGGSVVHVAPPDDDSCVLVSADGLEWTTSPTIDLPGDLGKLVPGSAHQADVWLRNVSGHTAILQLGVVLSADTAATFEGFLTMSAQTHEVEPTPVVAETNRCLPLFDDQPLRVGEQVKVTIDVRLDAAATNTSQGASVRPTFYATLVEETSGAVPPVGCTVPSNRPDTIASTGSPMLPWVIGGGVLAQCLLVAGAAVRLSAQRSARRS